MEDFLANYRKKDVDMDKVEMCINGFLVQNSQIFNFPNIHAELMKETWKALHELLNNSKHHHLHTRCLSCIRILSRDNKYIRDIINEDLLRTIAGYTGLKEKYDEESTASTLEALKCLFNLVYNCREVAVICYEIGILHKFTDNISINQNGNSNPKIQEFYLKIMFLLTALCPMLRQKLKELNGLTVLTNILEDILKDIAEESNREATVEQINIVCEVLKILFNISIPNNDNPIEDEVFIRLVPIIRNYLVLQEICTPMRENLINGLVNLLTNVPNSCFKYLLDLIEDGISIPEKLCYRNYNMLAILEILYFLHHRLSTTIDYSKQNELLSPVLVVLVKLVENDRLIRKFLRLQILPPLKDVHSRPEEGNTVRSQLCRLLTTPIIQVRDLSAQLLFVICKENVNRMIKYTGYGNAAGLFATRGLLNGKSKSNSKYSSESEDSDTEEYKKYKENINPVLGCYEEPHPSSTAHLTEEQKEHEAMKLVELMDKLSKTGIIQPCRVGADGKPYPVQHILELQQ